MAGRRELVQRKRPDVGPTQPTVEGGGQIARGVIPEGVKMARPGKGSLVFTSMMSGHDDDPNAKQRIPVEADREIALLFERIQNFTESAGGDLGSILNITFFVMDNAEVGPPADYHAIIEKEFTKTFPDPAHQPAHHTLNVAPAGLRGERVEAVLAAQVN